MTLPSRSAVRRSAFDVQRSTFAPSAFRRRLHAWFGNHGRDLPWRRTSDAYAVLVSELMLQQTTVAAVIPHFERWMRRFPDVATLAAASENDTLHAWQGLGYYARARHLHAAAKQIAREGWPNDLTLLPGVGRYTAHAVATFAFDRSVPIVEANTARLFARMLNLQTRIDSAAGQKALWDFASAIVPKRGAGAFNSALMDLGALVCVAGQPKCGECPVRGFCRADDPASLPLKKQRAALKQISESHHFVRQKGRVLLEQSTGRWRGMWILPSLPAPVDDARLLHRSHFPFTHHRVTLNVYSTTCATASAAQRWFSREQIDQVPMPSPHRRALNSLLAQVQDN